MMTEISYLACCTAIRVDLVGSLTQERMDPGPKELHCHILLTLTRLGLRDLGNYWMLEAGCLCPGSWSRDSYGVYS